MLTLIVALAVAGAPASLDAAPPTQPPPCPRAGEPQRFYPEHAAAAKISGGAVLSCSIGDDHYAHDCKVLSETPEGEGFGLAAQGLARCSLHLPGKPGTVVKVPIQFALPPH
jgi:protein TonB